MFNLGMSEIALILVLVLIFVGPKKLPDLASGLGRAIRQIRKTTADVKNEIVLDDTFRKPFEELRDAVTLAPEELKRRDQIKESLEKVRREAEELERSVRANLTPPSPSPSPSPSDEGQVTPPPEPVAAAPASEASAPWPPPVAPPPAGGPPVGTFPRSPTPFPRPPTPVPLPPGRLGGPQRVTPPISALSSNRANITQALSEEDLLPATKGAPPPPPPLPGVPPPPSGNKKG
jgi:TatA/E family protein of Tat protein translocase